MKKIIYFLCLAAFILTCKNVNAQVPGLTLYPQSQCYSAGNNSTTAYVSPGVPGAASYSWIVASPGGTCNASVSTYSSSAIANINFSCCGIYTVSCFAYNSSNSFLASLIQTCVVNCSNAITTSVSTGSILCTGSTAVIHASGASTYTWIPGNLTGDSIAVTPSVSTCYTVYGSSSGCTSSAVRCLTVSPSNSPTISSNSFYICSGGSAVLYASGSANYTWQPGGSNSPSISVSPSVTSCYTLSGSGCSGVSSAVRCVTVGSSPVLSISGNTAICANNTTTLTASGASSYTWYTSSGSFTGSTIALTPTATTCYSLIGTNSSGCFGYSGGCVTVLSASNPTISSNNFNICSGFATVLYASGATSYTWSPGGSNATSIVVNPSVTSCYTLSGSGCSGVSSAVRCVTVSSSPVLSISGNNTVCAGSGATLTASGASSYTWMTGSGTFTGSTIVLTPSATTCFSVIGSNSSGCMVYSGACVYVTPANNLTVTGNANICAGSTAYLGAMGATNYTWQPGNLTGDSIFVTPSVSTCYTVYGSSGTGCNGYAVKCVTVQPNSTVSITGANSICSGSFVVLNASGATSYTWLPGGSNSPSIIPTPSASTCYTLIGYSACAGLTSAVKCITVNPTPVISAAGNTTVCAGYGATLTASGASTYSWLTSSGTFTGTTIVLTPSASTCFSLVGANSSGCIGVTGVCVNVQGGNLSVSGNTSICSGASTTLTAGGAQTYTWLPGNIAGASIAVSPTASTCYTVIGNNSGGCNGSAVVCVVVNARPNIYTSSGFFCVGQSGTLTAFGANSYTWQPYNLAGASILITPTVSGCYTVSGTSISGCTNSVISCFSVMPSASVSISGNNVYCSGSPSTLTASGAQSYTWLPGNLTGSTIAISPSVSTCYTVIGNYYGCSGSSVKCMSVQSGPTVTTGGNTSFCAGSTTTVFANGAQTYTWLPGNLTGAVVAVTPSASTCYTVVGTSSNGCVGLGYLCVQSIPKPTLTTVNSGFICSGNSTTLSAQGASTYTWKPYNLTGSSIVVTPSASTCYTVLGTNSSGCTNSVIGCFSVIPSPVIFVTGNDSLCSGASTTLTASGASSYTWSPSAGYGTNIVVTPSTTTCYTVFGYSYGCISSAVKCVMVQQAANISISGNNIICAGTSANLLASGANTYTWNNGSHSQYITVTPTGSSCYTVTGTTALGCIGSAVKCLSVQPAPVINITGANSICYGGGLTLAASGASSYLWNTGSTASVISVAPATSTVYTVTGSNGICSGVGAHTVVVNPRPNITVFGSDSIICAGHTVTLTATGAVTYTWSDGEHFANIGVTPSVTTTYTVSGTNGNNCTNSSVITVFVSPCTGIAKNSSAMQIGMYPNPSSGQLTLQGDGATKINFSIYDVIGRELIKGEFTATKNVDLSGYTNGTYIIRFETGAASSYKKLVLEK